MLRAAALAAAAVALTASIAVAAAAAAVTTSGAPAVTVARAGAMPLTSLWYGAAAAAFWALAAALDKLRGVFVTWPFSHADND